MILLFFSLPPKAGAGFGIFWVALTLEEFTVGEAGIMPPDLAEAAEISNWNTSLHIPEFKTGPENCYTQIPE
jgi:hypothetical protein